MVWHFIVGVSCIVAEFFYLLISFLRCELIRAFLLKAYLIGRRQV